MQAIKKDSKFYFDGSIYLTYNKLFNQFVGGRGIGKTFWGKEWAIKSYIKTGAKFIYLRRHDTEIEPFILDKFLNDIRFKFPDNNLERDCNTFYCDEFPMGYAMSLSTYGNMRGIPFEDVDKIIFDEYIPENNRYIGNNEPEMFLNFYDTVDRFRTENYVRVCMFANMWRDFSPYFVHEVFNVKMPKKGKVFTSKECLLLNVDSSDYIKAKAKSRTAILYSGTKHGDFALNNVSLHGNNAFIEKKSKSRCTIIFKFNNRWYGVWEAEDGSRVWVSNDYNENCRFKYAFNEFDHEAGARLLARAKRDMIFKNFIDDFKSGFVWYENEEIKDCVYKLFGRV